MRQAELSPRLCTDAHLAALAMGRHHSGSDVDLCLVAPSLQLEDVLLLGARLDDLLLPWRFDLQLHHRINHPGLLAHIERVGVALLHAPAAARPSPAHDLN